MAVHKIVIETDFRSSPPQELYEDNPQKKKKKKKKETTREILPKKEKKNKTSPYQIAVAKWSSCNDIVFVTSFFKYWNNDWNNEKYIN